MVQIFLSTKIVLLRVWGGGSQKEYFKPIFNGYINNPNIKLLLKKYPKSFFIDQDEFRSEFFNQNLNFSKYKEMCKMIKHYNLNKIKQRVRLFYEFEKWMEFLTHNANFAYGQRIHGNIMALLAGLPVFVDVIDSRTREMAGFYNIPNSFDTPFNPKKQDLFELYQSLDFSEFNTNYKIKFARFCKFLCDNGLSNVILK